LYKKQLETFFVNFAQFRPPKTHLFSSAELIGAGSDIYSLWTPLILSLHRFGDICGALRGFSSKLHREKTVKRAWSTQFHQPRDDYDQENELHKCILCL
jgi:hypothetical protein